MIPIPCQSGQGYLRSQICSSAKQPPEHQPMILAAEEHGQHSNHAPGVIRAKIKDRSVLCDRGRHSGRLRRHGHPAEDRGRTRPASISQGVDANPPAPPAMLATETCGGDDHEQRHNPARVRADRGSLRRGIGVGAGHGERRRTLARAARSLPAGRRLRRSASRQRDLVDAPRAGRTGGRATDSPSKSQRRRLHDDRRARRSDRQRRHRLDVPLPCGGPQARARILVPLHRRARERQPRRPHADRARRTTMRARCASPSSAARTSRKAPATPIAA